MPKLSTFSYITVLAFLSVALHYGLRLVDLEIAGDRVIYARIFREIRNLPLDAFFLEGNLILKLLSKFTEMINADFDVFMFLIAFLQTCVYLIGTYIVGGSKRVLIPCALLLPFYFQHQAFVEVALAQGVAFSFILLWVVSVNRFVWLAFGFLLIAIASHWSAIIFLPLHILFLLRWTKVKKIFEVGFVFGMLVYIVGIPVVFRDFLPSAMMPAAWSNVNANYVLGFHPLRFVLFIGIVFLYYFVRNAISVESDKLGYLYIFFLYTAILGAIFSGFPYHGRLMAYGWALVPAFASLTMQRFKILPSKNYRANRLNIS